MNRYDIMVNGQLRRDLSEEVIQGLFRAGHVGLHSKCRLAGSLAWREVDGCLPMVKYEVPFVGYSSQSAPAPGSMSLVDFRASFEQRAAASHATPLALKAGWLAWGIAAAVAWLIPPAFLFYAVALVAAIALMASRQFQRGGTLALCSLLAMGGSAFVSMRMAVGVFETSGPPSTTLAAVTELKRQRHSQNEARQLTLNSFGAASGGQAAIGSAPQSREAAPAPQATPLIAPNSAATLETWSKRKILEETAKVEAQQRRMRKEGRDVPPSTTEYLTRLRMAYDRVNKR